MLEWIVLHQYQQRLEHGDGEHAVGQDRQQDMGENPGLLVDYLHRARRRELRQQHRGQSQWEQQQQQVFHRNA
ncbi:hypothetical protein D3C81_2262800 [compost metagenome]